jgi:hypothetical protein
MLNIGRFKNLSNHSSKQVEKALNHVTPDPDPRTQTPDPGRVGAGFGFFSGRS